jgi:hypothetical protein
LIFLKRASLPILFSTAILLLAGCKRSTLDYQPTGTIRDVMKSIVEPSADFIWDSIETIVTAKGIEKKQPHTDEEWTEEHNKAVALVEATNLLLIPNRHVAAPGQKADNPEFERDPADMEAMMKKDRATFVNRVAGLRSAAMQMLDAVNARDVAKIDELGGVLDKACEDCHTTYWYPPEP